MDSSYTQQPLGDGRVRFTVTPASPPKAVGAPLTLAVLFGLVVVGSTPGTAGGFQWIIRLAIAVIGGRYVFQLTNRWFGGKVDKLRSPGGTFTASPTGLEAAGATIARDALHRLIVRNGVPNVGDTVVVADNGSVYGGMQAGAARDRAANRAKAAQVSYMLCAEAGGRSTTLAGGMTEVTAHGLMTDTSRVLGMA